MPDTFLDKVYTVTSQEETDAIYDRWAETYDTEVSGEGYATPARGAAVLARILGDAVSTTEVLDYGCGTGLSAKALHDAGVLTIDGCDPSAGMLAQARAKGLYRDLWQLDPEAPFARDFRGRYPVITAIGVISAGAAPASVLPLLFGALPKGGRLVFSFNAHTLDDAGYMATLDTLLERRDATLEASEDGDHLPGIGLSSRIMVIRAL